MIDFFVMRIKQKKNSLSKVPYLWNKEVKAILDENKIDYND